VHHAPLGPDVTPQLAHGVAEEEPNRDEKSTNQSTRDEDEEATGVYVVAE
jgi:hypothetical protein